MEDLIEFVMGEILEEIPDLPEKTQKEIKKFAKEYTTSESLEKEWKNKALAIAFNFMKTKNPRKQTRRTGSFGLPGGDSVGSAKDPWAKYLED